MAKKIKYVGFQPVNTGYLPSFSVFNNSNQITIFNGAVRLSTVFTKDITINREQTITVTQKNVSLSDLKINNIDELNNFIKLTNKLKLNIDFQNLSSYATYGSLKEKFRFSINNIINKFPGGINFITYVSGVSYYSILDYTYDSLNDISTFKSPITVIDNPFFINLYQNLNLTANTISNLTQRYLDYTFTINDVDFGINGFTGFSNTNSSYLYFSINGNPLSGTSSPQNISENFLIKPNEIEYNKFYDSLNELERYFLNKNSTPKYSFVFKIPEVDENDVLTFKSYNFQFPTNGDSYNIDTISTTYFSFLTKLFEIGDLYDEYKSNLIIRKFLPKSVLDFDNTNSFKPESIIKIYGKEIDDIKKFIDSLMYVNNISYDKINNVPDALIKNLARTLGWKAQNIINDKDLLNSVFANDRSGDTDITASLAEVDIELWRRLVLNTSWFLKSKGTRKSIETILNFIGAPDCLLTFDEHVYVADAPIDKNGVFTPSPIPIPPNGVTGTDTEYILIVSDDDGYPINPFFTNDVYFQTNGIEDGGQNFIDYYTKSFPDKEQVPNFVVKKVVDNKKSWVYYESASTHSSTGRSTNYDINDSRLIINSKEVTLNIDTAKAIECDVYNFNKEYNSPVVFTSSTNSTYPQRESNNFSVTGLTLAEYIDKIYTSFINAQNRKVTDSAIGSHYPSLTKLYYDYYSNNNSNKRNFYDLSKYVDNLDSTFNSFIKQFIPATTIFDESSFNIRNTCFTPQKYAYKHGINDGSEFEAEVQLPFEVDVPLVTIESEFFDTYENEISIATIESSVNISDNGSVNTDNFTNVLQNMNFAPLWESKVCENEKSSFLMTGGTKIELSALTESSIFNKTTGTTHPVIFQFTSNTSTLSSNTTNFYYTVHRYDTFLGGFSDTIVFSSKTLGYTAFTGTNILNTSISGNILSDDSEYIIKPYFEYTTCPETAVTFSAISPYNDYEFFLISGYTVQSYIDTGGTVNFYNQSERYFDYSSFTITDTGSSITTLADKNSYIPLFTNYNSLDDYYFVSTSNAEKPILLVPQVNVQEQGLVTETTVVNLTEFVDFYLKFEPIGDIVVAVNGITIQKDLEYIQNPDPTLPLSIKNRAFRLLMRLTSLHDDILTVTYYRKQDINIKKLVKEDLNFTGSTQIVSAASGNYEISLTYPTYNSEIAVYLGGTILSRGTDYNLTLTDSSKVILLATPLNGSVFSVVYLTETDSIGVSTTIQPTALISNINWTTNALVSRNVTGKFIHQFYPLSDTGLTGNTLYTAETAYDYTLTNFSKTFDWSNSSPLSLGTTYYYRIASTKYFTTINNINLSSVTYSDTIKIKLPT